MVSPGRQTCHFSIPWQESPRSRTASGHVFKPFLRKCGERELALFGGEILLRLALALLATALCGEFMLS
ncbi:hypothetical protein AV530_005575 [Patagioenas fasciata monilis]|uniref:Uncharacterized protein n=1 Tax=Patagioenas fasciata monilis TaxID=372326 RepID=A0A1V4JLV6_PATFA|nr:hypothetical protein AV530_005575 [Patagioenas fasciata monilis]